MAPKRTGHGILGVIDGAGGGVSCVMTGVCVGVGSGAVVGVVVVFGGGGGGGGRDGRHMAPLGKGTTAIGTESEPGGGPLSVDGVT